MDYKKIHDQIISRARSENRSKKKNTDIDYIYYELHHIIPRCLGGSDMQDNLILLTAREHFVIHQLLVKIHPQNRQLIHAVNMMTRHDSVNRINNRLYAWLRVRLSQTISTQNKGMKMPPRAPEHTEKVRLSAIGRHQTPESNKKRSEKLKGRSVSMVTREKISASNLGRSVADSTRCKISKSKLGKKLPPFTDDHKRKISESNKGRKGVNSKPVICIETGIIFDSGQAAMRHVGLKNVYDIHDVCLGRRKRAGGYTWKYATNINSSDNSF